MAHTSTALVLRSILLAILAVSIESKITVEEFIINTDPKYIVSKTNVKHEAGKLVAAVDTTTSIDLDENLLLSAVFSHKVDGVFTPLVRLEKFALCKAFKENRKNQMVKLAMTMLKSLGDLPDGCPIKKGHYEVKDMEIEESFMIPMMSPYKGSFHIEILGHLKDKDTDHQIYNMTLVADLDQPGDE